MGKITAKFSEGIFFSNNNENKEKNDFYFNIFVSGKPRENNNNEQGFPQIYILGLEQLFTNDESIGSTMDDFASSFDTNGNEDWSISYGESPYGKCLIVSCAANKIKENMSVVFQLSKRYEFTAEFKDKESIGVKVYFDNFDTIFSDIDKNIEQISIVTAYEMPYIDEFEVLNSKGDKVKAIPDEEFGEISWSFGNVEKVSASLCDETGIEVANIPPHRVKIDKDRRFKLFAEKNGCKISRTLFIKDAYFINNTDDWNVFATAVNNGNTYADKLVVLGADITVSQKIGNSDTNKFFSGTFDGNGHTVTANIKGMALFNLIKGATIKNLTVAGTITGGIHTAGVVGYSLGSGNKIENCIVTATINGGTHIGGVLGHGCNSDIVIDNCVFKGLLNGGDIAKGVFFGWGDDGGAKSVTNCLYIMQNDQNKDYLDLANLNAGSVSVVNCYKTADIGTYGTLAYLTKPSDYSFIEKTAIDGTKFYVIAMLSGSGTEQNPYIINNKNDWNSFANLVSKKIMNGGKTYEGEYVKLNADITVSQKAGDSDKEVFFAGTFDGDGHTVTATIKDENKAGMALFNLIKGATIKNLTVAGTITGGIHTAGVVGYSLGSGNKIENCIVTATINGGTHIGGILGHGAAEIDNCVFKGMLNGGTIAIGVFLGWGYGENTMSVTNSLYIMQKNQEKQKLDLVKLFNGSATVTDSYKTADIGTYGTLAYLTKPSDFSTIEMTAVDGTKFYVLGLPSGSGTEADPYIINNEKDWISFANLVSENDENLVKTYEGEYLKLNADISVSQKIGDSAKSKIFSGTFDGNRHTITATIKDENKLGMALFHQIKGATIKNLTVAGSITGGGHAAGIVGSSIGSGNKILNCIVTATINGGTHIGGILGHGCTSDIVIDNCVFKGLFNGGSTAIGVFFGWGDNGGTKSVTNCLYIMRNDPKTPNIDLARMCYDCVVSVTNCYKTENVGTYGTLAYLTKPSDFSTIEMTAVDGTKFYVLGLPSGSGTEADPYIINNEKDWNAFAKLVSGKDMDFAKTYEGEYVKLNADITVSQKVGNSDMDIFFSGTFDGDGHTITAEIEDTTMQATALFRNIKGATIKNLTVAGSITGGWHAAGVVGCSMGSGNKIENCIVTATINGDSYIGGILGHGKDSSITIDNCVFKGLFNGGSTAIGVFFGWGDNGGTKSVTNCLYIMRNDPKTPNIDLARMCYDCVVSVTNCYKTENVGTYGTLVYLEKPSSGNYIEKIAIDGTKFYVLA